MKTIQACDHTYDVVTPEEFHKFRTAFYTTLEDEQHIKYSHVAYYYFCKEYLGLNEVILSGLEGRPTTRISQALKRMYERSTETGCPVEMMNAYQETVELCDDLARSMGIKGKRASSMKPFDSEYRMWLVSNEFGQPNSYINTEESVPYLVNRILDSIEDMDREEAVRHISRHYGVYTL